MGNPHGIRFTREEREKLAKTAAALRDSGMSQKKIAAHMKVSQATVSHWLRLVAGGQLLAGDRIAARIREELVCCDIFERMEAVNSADTTEQYRELRESKDFHPSCFYGGWAASLAEQAQ